MGSRRRLLSWTAVVAVFTALMGLLPPVVQGRVALRAGVQLPAGVSPDAALVGVVLRGAACGAPCDQAEQALAELEGRHPEAAGVVVAVGVTGRAAPLSGGTVATAQTLPAWALALDEAGLDADDPRLEAGNVYLFRRAGAAWELRAVLRGPASAAELLDTAERLVGPAEVLAAR